MAMKWACPKCGAEPNKHGDGGDTNCKSQNRHSCEGFLCDCDGDTSKEHGETHADPCHTAACYHCGWSGTFPRPLRNMKPWEKTALAAGWTPPAGWEDALKDSGRVAGKE